MHISIYICACGKFAKQMSCNKKVKWGKKWEWKEAGTKKKIKRNET